MHPAQQCVRSVTQRPRARVVSTRILRFIPATLYSTYIPFPPHTSSDPRVTLDAWRPPQILKAASCIHHCSQFTSIIHNHPSLLHRHSSFLQCSFHTIHPFPSSQPHIHNIRSHYSLYQPVLFHFLNMSKPPQHSSAQLASQLSRNTNIPLHLISQYALLHTYSSDTLSLLHFIFSSLLLPYLMFQPHIMQWAQLLLHITFIPIAQQLNTILILPNIFPTSLILDFTCLYSSYIIILVKICMWK